jgi:radical SAM superfamily enzyme YgiQ (UPF0313 family)
MRVGIVSVYVDYHRRGRKNRVSLQPQIGPLVAALLPRDIDIELVNEGSRDLDWARDYDLLFLSALHPDFDRARQIAHYWRRRGAKTVFGGALASTYPDLCQPWFDAIVIGDPETTVPALYRDFCAGELKPRYVATAFDPEQTPTPRFDLLADQAPHPLCFEATRGCPFTCDFCVLTGLGTRFHPRPVGKVLRDIVAGQKMLEGRVADVKRRVVGFCDNNIGGNLAYLRELCDALTPLRIQWYGAATFNVIANEGLVRIMARSGCRALFVGLESFNPRALHDMGKFQNMIHKTRAALDFCKRQGILVASGLLVSPLIDDPGYIRRIPELSRDSGLHVPTFLAFESPIPGTPYFRRLAGEEQPAFLPNALLRDFAGYTLVVRPRKATVEEFVSAYRDAVHATFAPARRLLKLAADLPPLLARGGWFPALIDVGDMATIRRGTGPKSARTFTAGTDAPPPERVPLVDADFDSESERRHILDPWRVTDQDGRAIPCWHGARTVFKPRRSRAGAAARGDRRSDAVIRAEGLRPGE